MTDRLLVTRMSTPVGPLTLLTDGSGTVVAAGFTADASALQARLPDRLLGASLRRTGTGPAPAALEAYFDGDLDALRRVQAIQDGGDFFQRAWTALREVPAGETVTYRELAFRAGNSSAVRAAGTACARNLVAPLVPCHRVVRSDGTVGGYAYGAEVKRRLLAHERRYRTG